MKFSKELKGRRFIGKINAVKQKTKHLVKIEDSFQKFSDYLLLRALKKTQRKVTEF